MNAIKDFLAEFWLWILIPAVLIGAGVVFLLYLSGGDSSSPFVYNVF